MKAYITIAIVLLSFQSISQRLKTTFTKDLTNWRFDGMSIRTTFSNDVYNWNFDNTTIKTTFSKDYTKWQIGNSIQLDVVFMGDLSQWEIKGNGKTIRVQTTFANDYERWMISGDLDGTIRTVFAHDLEQWEIEIDGETDDDILKAIVMIPIIAANFTQ